MKEKKIFRTRIIGLRLTIKEYEQIEKNWKASTCRKLSDYVRRSLFEKPIVTTYRNQSVDDFMSEAMRLRNELNSIGNNFNQAVKKLHTLHEIAEFKSWLINHETQKKTILTKVDEIKIHIQNIAEKWLQ
jgi:hypothetical protein